ncbi:metal-dependent hydrolase [Modestobacter sp. Leaf380]|uniref:metal-dependent hydrolase n=1 Tax=Modestobacter sp. Leaf380 TaxID=1736356 RepID=UPI0006F68A28|nr:metal-dependent hydrolase [Modestobacter sp. Leaf380]KQS73320.1 metal-dependent hydrolase [Modestobacter sp. Leaf380]
MLGHSHALSGLAVGAATLPLAPLSGTVAQLGWVAAVGGMAMLPDLDQRGSTISRMWGPLSEVPSGVVGTLSGGHRRGTHDAVLAPLAFGALAFAASRATWSALLLLALAIGLALRALHVVVPGRFETTVVGNLVLSWGGAWLLLAHSPSPTWLPWAVGLGVLVHVAGDFLTCGGVPVPLVWLVRPRAKVHFSPMETGGFTERVVLVPLFVVATVVLLWLNTPAAEVLGGSTAAG